MDRSRAFQAFTGPVPSFRTPFDRSGEIDYDACGRLVERLLEAEPPSILLTAGDSHYLCLSDEEILDLTGFVARAVGGRTVLVGADRYHATPRAPRFAEELISRGADLVMTMPPNWGQPNTPKLLAEHYAAVAKVAPVMIVTNILGVMPIDAGLETVERALDASDRIVAIKDDCCRDYARRLAGICEGRVALISGGQKSNHLDMHPYGGTGYLSTFMTFRPEVARRYWSAIESGDVRAAGRIVREIDMPFFRMLNELEGGFDAGLHGVMELFGITGRWRRPPYHSLSDEQMDSLAAWFEQRGLLEGATSRSPGRCARR